MISRCTDASRFPRTNARTHDQHERHEQYDGQGERMDIVRNNIQTQGTRGVSFGAHQRERTTDGKRDQTWTEPFDAAKSVFYSPPSGYGPDRQGANAESRRGVQAVVGWVSITLRYRNHRLPAARKPPEIADRCRIGVLGKVGPQAYHRLAHGVRRIGGRNFRPQQRRAEDVVHLVDVTRARKLLELEQLLALVQRPVEGETVLHGSLEQNRIRRLCALNDSREREVKAGPVLTLTGGQHQKLCFEEPICRHVPQCCQRTVVRRALVPEDTSQRTGPFLRFALIKSANTVALCAMALWKYCRESSEKQCIITLLPPELAPKMVTLFGSPANVFIF
uniref:Uncharacterized protein n=1 Tax=Anopheles atroparvus TaxID=41427 RepID=A0A182IVA0_ANOAO